MIDVSVFDAMELDNTNRRVASRRALALAHNRVERNLGRFLRGAQTEEEFLERLGLVQDDFAGYVSTAAEEVGHEHPEHIAAALKDHYRLAADHVEFKKTPEEEVEEEEKKEAARKVIYEGERPASESVNSDGKVVQKNPAKPYQLVSDPYGEEEKDEEDEKKEAAANEFIDQMLGQGGNAGAPPNGGSPPVLPDASGQGGNPNPSQPGTPPIAPGAPPVLPNAAGQGGNPNPSAPPAPGQEMGMQGPGVPPQLPGLGQQTEERFRGALGSKRTWSTIKEAPEGKQGRPLVSTQWAEDMWPGGAEKGFGQSQYPSGRGGECPECGDPQYSHGGHGPCPTCGYDLDRHPIQLHQPNPRGQIIADTAKVTCPECGGDGKTAGSTECPKCHGGGKVENFGESVLDKLESKTAINTPGLRCPECNSQNTTAKGGTVGSPGTPSEGNPTTVDRHCRNCGNSWTTEHSRESSMRFAEDGNTDLGGPSPKMDKAQWTRENPGEPKVEDGVHKTERKDPVEVIGPMRNDHELKEIGDIEHKDLPSSKEEFADNNMAQGAHTKTFGNGGQVDPVTNQALASAYLSAIKKEAMGMSAMDFRMLADAIRTAPEGADKPTLANHVAQYLSQTNPMFDAERFMAAAAGDYQSGRDEFKGYGRQEPELPQLDPNVPSTLNNPVGPDREQTTHEMMSSAWPSDIRVEAALAE